LDIVKWSFDGVEYWLVEVCGVPGLKSETWGTRLDARVNIAAGLGRKITVKVEDAA
jgi:hypothetical protein